MFLCGFVALEKMPIPKNWFWQRLFWNSSPYCINKLSNLKKKRSIKFTSALNNRRISKCFNFNTVECDRQRQRVYLLLDYSLIERVSLSFFLFFSPLKWWMDNNFFLLLQSVGKSFIWFRNDGWFEFNEHANDILLISGSARLFSNLNLDLGCACTKRLVLHSNSKHSRELQAHQKKPIS